MSEEFETWKDGDSLFIRVLEKSSKNGDLSVETIIEKKAGGTFLFVYSNVLKDDIQEGSWKGELNSPHGNYWNYKNGCRCGLCRMAANEYVKLHRKKTGLKKTKNTSVPHGNYSRYINSGCRCELCKKAFAEYSKEYKRIRKSKKVT
jgi:hypothetical protein